MNKPLHIFLSLVLSSALALQTGCRPRQAEDSRAKTDLDARTQAEIDRIKLEIKRIAMTDKKISKMYFELHMIADDKTLAKLQEADSALKNAKYWKSVKGWSALGSLASGFVLFTVSYALHEKASALRAENYNNNALYRKYSRSMGRRAGLVFLSLAMVVGGAVTGGFWGGDSSVPRSERALKVASQKIHTHPLTDIVANLAGWGLHESEKRTKFNDKLVTELKSLDLKYVDGRYYTKQPFDFVKFLRKEKFITDEVVLAGISRGFKTLRANLSKVEGLSLKSMETLPRDFDLRKKMLIDFYKIINSGAYWNMPKSKEKRYYQLQADTEQMMRDLYMLEKRNNKGKPVKVSDEYLKVVNKAKVESALKDLFKGDRQNSPRLTKSIKNTKWKVLDRLTRSHGDRNDSFEIGNSNRYLFIDRVKKTGVLKVVISENLRKSIRFKIEPNGELMFSRAIAF